MLVHDGHERPLIPRYFDLLVFLIERRHEAVHRRDIFDRVWNDVVVSDSALSQAIRTIRRTLGDDSREPRFIRTVSRHGYRFVFPDVLEEEDDDEWPDHRTPAGRRRTGRRAGRRSVRASPAARDRASRPTPATKKISAKPPSFCTRSARHEALQRLGTRPRHAFARALLRDTRWETADAGRVPILGQPAPIAAAAALVSLRLRRAARIAAARWAGASAGGGLAGVVGGARRRIDARRRARQRGAPGRRRRARRHRRMLRCCRRRRRRRGLVGRRSRLTIAADDLARLRRRAGRRPRRLDGAMVRSMESGRARGRARRHRRRPGGSRHRRGGGARLFAGDRRGQETGWRRPAVVGG